MLIKILLCYSKVLLKVMGLRFLLTLKMGHRGKKVEKHCSKFYLKVVLKYMRPEFSEAGV